jgi:hypothetical protein
MEQVGWAGDGIDYPESVERSFKNMDILTLNYLHDASVQKICFVHNAEGVKELIIQAHGHEDCGYQEWAGKNVTVSLVDVIVSTGALFGHVTGEDSIAGFDEEVSETTPRLIAELVDAGISCPTTVLKITFHSGSFIEVACHGIDVTVVGMAALRSSAHLDQP